MSEFLSVESIESKAEDVNTQESFYALNIMLDANLSIHKRKVVGIMEFLENAGGIWTSLFIIGAVLNFFLTGKESSA